MVSWAALSLPIRAIGLGVLAAGWVLAACRPNPTAARAPLPRVYVSRDERVHDWRLNGEKNCPVLIHAPSGCYVLEARYMESYTRVRGRSVLWAVPPFWTWGISWAAAGLSDASRIHSSNYSTGYVPFALKLRGGHRYYVTATFDGDEFMPRIVELNAAAERTREILPAASLDELKACASEGAELREAVEAICAPKRNR